MANNLRTTITALEASLGTTTNARRAAYFHVIFNLVGVFWITLIFQWYIGFIQAIIGVDVTQPALSTSALNQRSQPALVDGNETYPNTVAAIAATHSVFNVCDTLLSLPFVMPIVRHLERFIPSRPYKEKPRLTDWDVRILETPLLAIEPSRKEILKMGNGCLKMLDWHLERMLADEPDQKLGDRLRQRERVLDSVQNEVAEFVTNLLTGNVSHATAEEGRRLLQLADEYESISDYIANLDKFDRKLRRERRVHGGIERVHPSS